MAVVFLEKPLTIFDSEIHLNLGLPGRDSAKNANYRQSGLSKEKILFGSIRA